MTTILAAPASGPAHAAPSMELERRRSDRIAVDIPLELEGSESVSLVELSLGGATLETSSRPTLHVAYRLHLGYRGSVSEVTLVAYQAWLHELFYAPRRRSEVRYRVRVTFRNPSVAALNLIYRIMLEHWTGSRSSDFVPSADSIPASH